MPRAFSNFKASPSYRARDFAAGLEALGYEMCEKWQKHPEPDDLLLLWNRTRTFDHIAKIYEDAGAHVIIAENGFLGADEDGSKLFALARNYHNGAGSWYIGKEPRREFEVKPWRQSGDHILLLPQRGIGARGVAMPTSWLADIQKRLAKITDRPIRIRRHPGADRSDPWPDLRGAHCAITWGSGAGLKSLVAGIPVFHELERWIGAPAAKYGINDIEACHLNGRAAMLHRLSWAQWSSREIRSGEAFSHLIDARGHSLLRADQLAV